MADRKDDEKQDDKRQEDERLLQRATGFAQVLMPRSLGVKVGILLAVTAMVIGGFVLYVLDSRGVFEDTQRLRLVTDNAEGIGVGTDLTFAGFPIGRVRRIVLRDDGKVQINVRVPVSEAKWLRTSTIFVIDVPVVGAAKLRAFSGNLQDPPLPDRAERPVLRGDTAQEIPRMVATLKSTLENIEQLTGPGGSLQASLANLQKTTERLNGRYGALGAVLGGDAEAAKVIAAIDRANNLLRQIDAMVGKTDQRLFGERGVVTQVSQILGEVRESLKKADQLLADAQAVSGNVKAATSDLGTLRAEVDASLRRVSALIDEVNRKWPFQRESEIKLP